MAGSGPATLPVSFPLYYLLAFFHYPSQGRGNNQISIAFHRQNPTALYYHHALRVFRGPCEAAPRLP